MSKRTIIDGNTAAADVAYRLNEVCAIFPITPSSTMAELVDEWAAQAKTNIWGNIPHVQEMQSEGGAAGAVHGALQSGSLTTTFTASQGLMLMLPNMYKIAGELTSTVFHVAARALATSALSIFGDHSDVMAARTTGFALFSSGNVQEAHDAALLSQVATLKSRVPFLHFFDGFRTSHELNTLEILDDSVLRTMIDDDLVYAHRARALNPENPFIRGTAHNPDTFFQAREAVNPYYEKVPDILQEAMNEFARLTGRQYKIFDYYGAKDPEKVLILMGAGAKTAIQAAKLLEAKGEKVGVIQVRLFRPFSVDYLLDILPKTVKKIAVLEQHKEVGSSGEPLYQDIIVAMAQAITSKKISEMPVIIGGRYGLSNKDFTPAMAMAVYAELDKEHPRNSFTVGINDDVSHTSLTFDRTLNPESSKVTKAVFFGLGADGTVGANKNSVKIIGEDAGLYAQGFFVYDSHKSGAQTISHLRFGPDPIDAPYLIEHADFVACHKFEFLERQDILKLASHDSVFLLNAPYDASEVWDKLSKEAQEQIIEKRIKFYVINATAVAKELGLGFRVNTILQTCFFSISGVLDKDQAIKSIKAHIQKSYGRKGEHVVQQNYAAVDGALKYLQQVAVPAKATSVIEKMPLVPANSPEFIQKVTAKMFAAEGDSIPVSEVPADGTFPSGTCALEKRNVSDVIPEWRSDLCIQCGQCSFVCPHAVIRSRYYNEKDAENAPEGFQSVPVNARGYPESKFTLQIYIEDCTGCNLCVEACPAHSPIESETKALNMIDKADIFEREKENIKFFETLPVNNRAYIDFSNVRGVQFLQPLFEFPGACAGCGETPYLRLLSQLFGDRMQVANATGCSSIYGGNLPVTPWAKNHEGRGPAWSNSLFEDNAEFGLGYRLAADNQLELAIKQLDALKDVADAELIDEIIHAPQEQESEIREQRERIAALKVKLLPLKDKDIRVQNMLSLIDHLVRRSIWIIGGDGWAYDIGYGGLDHVLATGKNVNILVLDTEVYSNTGGQASKATPMAAIAKFATGGKHTPRKDLALQAIAYGNVYVAQVAMGANPQQTLQAFREAENYDGPSIILAYSHCIAHGIDMTKGMQQQHFATETGYWPLFRFDPRMRTYGKNPFRLDSNKPSMPLSKYAYNEIRYKALLKSNPKEAEHLMHMAQNWVNERYRAYEDLAARDGSRFQPDPFESGIANKESIGG
ncbi:pyruvate-flavodoxin oxidoreductase [Commensalibacter intestini]|uniref:Pyruvate-flavodoxin oxidoreductase n=1 Tax=Commensalibacter intestini TaxID=479936 RepID=A0A251ZVR5_9PROT|nr:pyruvate:ferredoxin (flavodoxin) oxidoreductase [Commensalibacter intestini]OUI78765.1 pyruvate-flavodoxin oxidoreductase [Commensalibacter intestini]